MTVCKLCEENEPLIEAHIIPKGFFEYMYPEGDRRPYEEDLRKVMLLPNQPLYILNIGRFDKSPEFKALWQTMQNTLSKNQLETP